MNLVNINEAVECCT